MDCKVLIVEDEETSRVCLTDMLELENYKVYTVAGGEEAKKLVEDVSPHIVLTDLKLLDMNGIEVIRAVKEISPKTICIVITGYATIETAVEAMKAGAFSYLKKPFRREELLVTLKKAQEVLAIQEENDSLKLKLQKQREQSILGTSPQIQMVRDIIKKVADTDSTVLILGESGTGKELVAKELHRQSSRSGNPFIPINCGAIPEELLESELFGYEKGAFIGAIATKIGRFEAADKGTVFLDEIGDMSVGLQVKILRVLQEREFERIGGRKSIKVDIRIIAATNQDLERAVAEKRFREDLYYRLNVIPVELPPLRERPEDIPYLVKHFLRKFSTASRKKIHEVEDEALDCLVQYPWPGNVRELENAIEYAYARTSESVIRLARLPLVIRRHHGRYRRTVTPQTEEAWHLLALLEKHHWNRSRVAREMGIGRTTLWRKMKSLGIAHT